jgi:hypothetical protein
MSNDHQLVATATATVAVAVAVQSTKHLHTLSALLSKYLHGA